MVSAVTPKGDRGLGSPTSRAQSQLLPLALVLSPLEAFCLPQRHTAHPHVGQHPPSMGTGRGSSLEQFSLVPSGVVRNFPYPGEGASPGGRKGRGLEIPQVQS